MNVLIVYSDGTSVVKPIEWAMSEYNVSKQQILWAIKSGHHLKTMLFDEALE